MTYTKEDIEKIKPFAEKHFQEILKEKLNFYGICDENVLKLLKQDFEATVMDAIIYLSCGEESYQEVTKNSLRNIRLVKIGNL